MVDLGGVFHPFWGLMGTPGVKARGDASWDVEEARGCNGWIVICILGRFDLTLTACDRARGKWLIWGVFSVLLGV